jgi:hypothetical protein
MAMLASVDEKGCPFTSSVYVFATVSYAEQVDTHFVAVVDRLVVNQPP